MVVVDLLPDSLAFPERRRDLLLLLLVVMTQQSLPVVGVGLLHRLLYDLALRFGLKEEENNKRPIKFFGESSALVSPPVRPKLRMPRVDPEHNNSDENERKNTRGSGCQENKTHFGTRLCGTYWGLLLHVS